MPRSSLRFVWPHSLVGRVFALYTLALVGFVGAGLALFIRNEFTVGLDNAQRRAEGLVTVMAPTIVDSAVIGDYDTIQKTLSRALRNSDFAAAFFIDKEGGVLEARSNAQPRLAAPAWLTALIAGRLYETNQPITAGGRDYGVLRLTYAPGQIAAVLWQQALFAIGLGALALAGGLICIHLPLKRWLGDLDRLQSFDRAPASASRGPLPEPDDAPIELRRTFEALSRAARARESALAALRKVLERLLPQPAVAREGADDIEAISQMISVLTARLQQHGDQLDAIFALSPDGFVSFDRDRLVSYISPSFTELTGLAAETVRGLSEDQLCDALKALCGPDQPASICAPLKVRTGEGDPRVTITVERPRRRTLALTLRAGAGDAVSQLLHVRDITRETEVDRLKSEFLSTAAHELRTPMASIYGYAELLLHRKMAPERQREAIATVHRQSVLLTSIINELLDLARIEARGARDFTFERAELGALVRECVQDFQVPDGRAAPVVQLPAAPLWAEIDRGKMLQALRNVLSNAYKYSPRGGDVEISVTPGAGDGTAVIGVLDQGMGMTTEQAQRVGERFYRADTSGNIPGTGLGMAIVKEIVELLSGRLRIESAPGVGTNVEIVLPVATGGAGETPTRTLELAA